LVDAKTYLFAARSRNSIQELVTLAGTPLITRDFTNVNGFAMVTPERIEAHNFLLDQAVEEIEYKDYKIVGHAKLAVQQRPRRTPASCPKRQVRQR
jgi:hypothetical protein